MANTSFSQYMTTEVIHFILTFTRTISLNLSSKLQQNLDTITLRIFSLELCLVEKATMTKNRTKMYTAKFFQYPKNLVVANISECQELPVIHFYRNCQLTFRSHSPSMEILEIVSMIIFDFQILFYRSYF